ncbi:MAG: carboxypeptidase regulatory-like domain-containing protein [Ruminococcus sp.]|nr:carboxypeptidase regulatory-like domain-containing protein [Ruminococcus sp.]
MQLNELSAQSERYKKELMKLYGRRCTEEETAPAEEVRDEVPREEELPQKPPEDEEVFGVDEEAPDDTSYSEYAEEENIDSHDSETEYNNRYPAPDLSVLGDGTLSGANAYDTPPQYVSEESLGRGKGYILVNVRAGDEATPIEGATVMVTAIVDGSRLILAEGLTNSSGTTEKFAVPAPDIIHSQTPDAIRRPYNLFDVSVTAKGYFNARSVDVPVFDGITSVQNFSMIPVPLMMRASDETLTYFNQEPDFDGAADS